MPPTEWIYLPEQCGYCSCALEKKNAENANVREKHESKHSLNKQSIFIIYIYIYINHKSKCPYDEETNKPVILRHKKWKQM